jgi:hypothetical protein
MLRFVLLLGCLTFLPGCTRREWVRHRFLAEHPASPSLARAASECIAGCEPLWSRDRSGYGACLSACPTIEVTANASCDAVKPHTPFCYELVEEREIADEAAARLVGDIIGAAVGAVLDAALDDERPGRSRAGKKVRKVRSSRLPGPDGPRRPGQHL